MVELGRRHRLGERAEIDALAFRRGEHRLLAGEECDVILRRHVLGDAIRDVDVLVAVQIEISEQRAPAPVSARHARHLADVAERPVAVI